MKHRKRTALMRLIPLALCGAALLICALQREKPTAEDFILHAPSQPWRAAVLLVLAYAFKGGFFFIPMSVLYVSGGLLFSPGYAVLVNALGAAAELSVTYWGGRASKIDIAGRLAKRYPKIREAGAEPRRSPFGATLFLRLIGGLPADIVSAYLGTLKISFAPYLAGSLLGMLPRITVTTLIGTGINQPGSTLFWVSVASSAVLAAVSVLLLARRRRRAGAQNAQI